MNEERRTRPLKLFEVLSAYGPYRVGDRIQPTGLYRDQLLRRGVIKEVTPAALEAEALAAARADAPAAPRAAEPAMDRMLEPGAETQTRAGRGGGGGGRR